MGASRFIPGREFFREQLDEAVRAEDIASLVALGGIAGADGDAAGGSEHLGEFGKALTLDVVGQNVDQAAAMISRSW